MLRLLFHENVFDKLVFFLVSCLYFQRVFPFMGLAHALCNSFLDHLHQGLLWVFLLLFLFYSNLQNVEHIFHGPLKFGYYLCGRARMMRD